MGSMWAVVLLMRRVLLALDVVDCYLDACGRALLSSSDRP